MRSTSNKLLITYSAKLTEKCVELCRDVALVKEIYRNSLVLPDIIKETKNSNSELLEVSVSPLANKPFFLYIACLLRQPFLEIFDKSTVKLEEADRENLTTKKWGMYYKKGEAVSFYNIDGIEDLAFKVLSNNLEEVHSRILKLINNKKKEEGDKVFNKIEETYEEEKEYEEKQALCDIFQMVKEVILRNDYIIRIKNSQGISTYEGNQARDVEVNAGKVTFLRSTNAMNKLNNKKLVSTSNNYHFIQTTDDTDCYYYELVGNGGRGKYGITFIQGKGWDNITQFHNIKHGEVDFLESLKKALKRELAVIELEAENWIKKQ